MLFYSICFFIFLCLLTQLGTGPYKSGSGNGYYSTADFIEILKFASARHIEVVPKIDMPGHARVAVKPMEARYKKLLKVGKKSAAEQYLLSDPQDKSEYITVQNYTDNSINVCLPSTYIFVEKVIYELQQMYRKAGTTFVTFHMGGAMKWGGRLMDGITSMRCTFCQRRARYCRPGRFEAVFCQQGIGSLLGVVWIWLNGKIF